MKIIKYFLIALSLSSPLHAEGWFSMSPSHDFVNGNGQELSLEVEQPLRKPLSLTGAVTASSFETYQDLIGTVGFEWECDARVTIGVGYSYDRFSMSSDAETPFYSRNVYGRLKVRLW